MYILPRIGGGHDLTHVANCNTGLIYTYVHLWDTVIVWQMPLVGRQVRYVHTFTYKILWVFDRWHRSSYGLDIQSPVTDCQCLTDGINRQASSTHTHTHTHTRARTLARTCGHSLSRSQSALAHTHTHTHTHTHQHRLFPLNFAPYDNLKISY